MIFSQLKYLASNIYIFFKHIYSRVFFPIKTFIGYVRLQSIKAKTDNFEWELGFYKKKVLIIGTGPSLDKVGKDYFEKFDTLVYINHAVKIAKKNNNEFFFSTDITEVKNIKVRSYYKNILFFGSKKSIIAPIHFQSVLELDAEFISNFTWLSANKGKFKYLKSKKAISIIIPLIRYWPEQLSKKQLDIWFSKKYQSDYFPVIESTSALSAILFVSKYKPESVSLIGCDFSAGRSNAVVNEYAYYKENLFNEAKVKYIFIKEYLLNNGVLLNNDSWD